MNILKIFLYLHVKLLPKLNYHIHKSSFTEGLVQQTLKLSGHTPRDKKKIKKQTNTRWLIDAKAHLVLALNVGCKAKRDRTTLKIRD